MKKKYFDNKFSDDKDCSLLPPAIYVGDEANSEFFCRENRRWQSAPCVTKTHGGRIFCTFSGDNSDVGDESPNNYNTLMYSDDDGRTWKENVIVVDHEDSVRIHGPIVFIAPDGTLFLFWAQSYIYWDSRAGVWSMECKNPDDDILSWSEPRRICHGVLACPPCVTSKGEILLPVSIWKNITRHAFNHIPELEYSCVYASSDGGKSFEFRGKADDPDTTFDENAIVETNNGRLLMITRDTAAISICSSEDDGRTWTKPEKLMDHTSSRSFLSRFPSGNILLVTNDPAGIRNDLKQEENRVMMTAFLSCDGGKSFPHRLLLKKEGSVSYPAGVIMDDGVAYVAFDRNRYTDGEIYMSRFSEEDIIAGKIIAEGSYSARLLIKADKLHGKHKIYEDGSTY